MTWFYEVAAQPRNDDELLTCFDCGEPAYPEDYIEAIGEHLCPACLEDHVNADQ